MPLFGSMLAIGAAACVDAPITSEHLQPNGELLSSVQQAAFSVPERQAKQVVHVSAVLAAEPSGALRDENDFLADVGAVHLHLRADGLVAPRPVIYRWTHEGTSTEVLGLLAPTGTLSLATSHAIAPRQVGTWQVEVLTVPAGGEPASVLYQRNFEVTRPQSR